MWLEQLVGSLNVAGSIPASDQEHMIRGGGGGEKHVTSHAGFGAGEILAACLKKLCKLWAVLYIHDEVGVKIIF